MDDLEINLSILDKYCPPLNFIRCEISLVKAYGRYLFDFEECKFYGNKEYSFEYNNDQKELVIWRFINSICVGTEGNRKE
ncbi:hypothetical protein CHQ84_01590 [Francisella noatunensis subsp. orientalis]|uniref:Uncharacterized protein n=1 Tax=Francisella orientalis TaxID=299583 RepID=A0AAP6X5K0_9GAMM|nr:hypothetical protein M973_01675 [Francisella orientalis LADL 07-285A]AKN85036.1 hypothetical protein FNO12_0247 [Francisella orientalis FNO12]AKN86574.1 Hypothetical protein FNO24_0247 [Francisella orientalis FNO24]AKN88112.1 Hypothetical protein FNO190_0247 [Francisella orientalis]AKU04867.1 Hypothetical protein FNO01_0247 [Francisella orientalis]